MEKEKAATLEGMMLASRTLLQALADYVRENVPDQQRRAIMLKIGTATAELIDISRMIYDEHPGLNPYAEQDQLAAKCAVLPHPESPRTKQLCTSGCLACYPSLTLVVGQRDQSCAGLRVFVRRYRWRRRLPPKSWMLPFLWGRRSATLIH